MNKTIIFILLILFTNSVLFSQDPQTELSWLEKSIQLPTNFKWFNPNLLYLQINTNKDAIYFITGKDIIAVDSRFNGKIKDYLHILHNGVEKPFFFTDNNPNLSENDTIIFIGSRPKGDTTWFDCFSQFEVFYLVYDESTPGKRFTRKELLSSIGSEIDFTYYYEHFEEAHKYSIGMPEFSSETVPGEGWVWELLQPNPSTITSKSLKITTQLFPAELNDSVYFKFFAFSSRYELNKTIHNILIKINGDTAFLHSFSPGKDIVFSFSYPASKVYFGNNEIEVISLGLPLPDSLQPEDIVGIQYIEVGYRRYLLSYQNLLKLPIKANENHSYNVFGLKSQDVVVIDTNNQEVFLVSGKPNIHFFSNIQPDSPRVVTIINDSILYSNEKGLHIYSFDSLNKAVTYKYFPDNSNQILTYINSLASSTIFFSIFNGTTLPNNVIEFYKSHGSTKVDGIKNGNFWAFALNPIDGNIQENISPKDRLFKFHAAYLTTVSNLFSAKLTFVDTTNRFLYVAPKNFIEKPNLLKVDTSNLFSIFNQADVLVIAPNELSVTAEAYIQYRKKTRPSLNCLFASTENIYKEFNFGKKSPHAIKRMLVWAFNKWQKPRPKFLVIFGDASWDVRQVLQNSPNKDYVPTYGWPATDYWYSLIDSVDYNADISVGRIPIHSNEEGKLYLQKLSEYESSEESPWMKNFLFLSGGITEQERNYFYDLLKGYFADYILANSPICSNPIAIRKSDPGTVGEADASAIRTAINNGVQLMYFAGHGSALVFDTDGWPVQTLNNKGRYGFFASFSCNTATFAEPNIISRNEDYVIWPDKGFIGTLGSTGVSFRVNTLTLGNNFLSIVANPKYKTSNFVELLNIAKRQQTFGEYTDLLTIYHYNFLGDPLLEFKIPRKPDLYFLKQTIKITNENNSPNFQQTDTLFIITGKIANLGFTQFGRTFKLRLLHSFNGTTDSIDLQFPDLCSPKDFLFKIPIRSQVGTHFFRLLINPEEEIEEANFLNNSFEMAVEVFSNPIFIVEPQQFWNVSQKFPLFRFIDPEFSPDSFIYHLAIFEKPDTTSQKLAEAKPNDLYFSNVFIQWTPKIQLDTGTYWLYLTRINKISFAQTKPLWINFNTYSATDSTNVILNVEPEDNLNFFDSQNLQYDDNSRSILLKPDSIKYKILSASSRRGKEIVINDRVYVSYTTQTDLVGFYLVILSHKDFKVTHNKYFDTWAPKDNLPPLQDSNSIQLYYFLRDSIPKGDYLFLLAYGSSLALPLHHQWYNPKSPGSVDSLRAVLRDWGCKQCDSLGIDPQVWGSSYFIVARNTNPPKLIAEGFNFAGDTVSAEGTILQYPTSALLSTNYFGSATKWNFLNIETTSDSSILTDFKLIGRKKDFPYTDSILLKTSSNRINLKEIDANQFPLLKCEINISNPNQSDKFYFRRLRLEYTPLAEIASEILEPTSTIVLERGEEFSAKVKIYNLSSRITAKNINILFNSISNNGIKALESISLPELLPNAISTAEQTFLTDNFDNPTQIQIREQTTIPEYFSFNNSSSFVVKLVEDTLPPEIRLYADSYKLNNGDYVTRQPKLLIEIYDNSRIPYDSTSTRLLINAKWVDLSKRAQFTSFERNTPLKCSYFLISDSLEFGSNYFTIYTTDPAGNRDTLDVKVILSNRAQINEEIAYPNPTSNSSTFRFHYLSPISNATARIDIFDQMGNRIRTIFQNLKLNQNEIFWDGFDEAGNSTPQGIFFYRISIISEIYCEPVFGKIIKVQ